MDFNSRRLICFAVFILVITFVQKKDPVVFGDSNPTAIKKLVMIGTQ